jgi:hypothetical protein
VAKQTREPATRISIAKAYHAARMALSDPGVKRANTHVNLWVATIRVVEIDKNADTSVRRDGVLPANSYYFGL